MVGMAVLPPMSIAPTSRTLAKARSVASLALPLTVSVPLTVPRPTNPLRVERLGFEETDTSLRDTSASNPEMLPTAALEEIDREPPTLVRARNPLALGIAAWLAMLMLRPTADRRGKASMLVSLLLPSMVRS